MILHIGDEERDRSHLKMATAVFGKIDEYDSEKEDWPNYVE